MMKLRIKQKEMGMDNDFCLKKGVEMESESKWKDRGGKMETRYSSFELADEEAVALRQLSQDLLQGTPFSPK